MTDFDDLKGKNSSDLELEPDIIPNIDEDKSQIPNNDFIEYVFDTVRKTIKQENSLIRQIAYTALSTYTNDPINLGIMAPTSEGKTYPVIQVMQLFPKQDVWNIGSMTPKVLVRMKGTLVDRDNNPIGDEVKRLNKEIARLGTTKNDRVRKVELKDELSILLEGAKSLIELSGTILLFLEAPHPELWNIIKPILSHDLKEIEFPYVDTSSGVQVKKVVVRGSPACIFCSAKDESKWLEWDQIRSRFLITSPNMIQKKYLESNLLIAQKKGLPSLLQQDIIVKDEDVALAKLCVLNIKNRIIKLSKNGHNTVWIPYGLELATRLPDQKGSDNRTTGRIFSFINIIAMTKSHLREELGFGPETLAIAGLQDLNEALHITHNMTGIPTYKVKFFKNTFIPCLKSKTEPDKNKDGSKEENIIGVTTRELCDHYKVVTGKTINSDNLKKTFLAELIDYGFIDEQDSVIHHQRKIYTAMIILPDQEELDENWSSLSSNLNGFDEKSYDIAINLPKHFINVKEHWLKLVICERSSRRIGLDKIAVRRPNGEEVSTEDFIKEYESKDRLAKYFIENHLCDISLQSKIFSTLKNINNNEAKNDKLIRRENIADSLDIYNNNNDNRDELTDLETEIANTSSKTHKFDENSDMYADIKPPPRPSGFTSDTEESKESENKFAVDTGYDKYKLEQEKKFEYALKESKEDIL